MVTLIQSTARNALVISFLACLASMGCSAVTITPELPVGERTRLLVKGPLEYSGKSDYQPRTVSAESVSEQGLSFRYSTAEAQDRSGWDLFALFNPLTILGSPTGELTSTVTGTLEVFKDGQIVKVHAATCVIKATKGLYYGEDFSELRRKGLIAVRDNIEAQMADDRGFYEPAGRTNILH